jgi:nucleoside-diphosphate-sugar epimerase
MRVLFIGGTGTISAPCSQRALERGIELFLLNRGRNLRFPAAPGAQVLTADIHKPDEVRRVLHGLSFDAVVDWVAFDVPDIENDLALFRGRTAQFIFISSASAYQKPPTHPVITESTPLCNPFWEYSRKKIACEERLLRAYCEEGFPVTIVRPSHTYYLGLPASMPYGAYGIIERMRQGKPILVHGDGTSLWCLTHSEDFAKGFVGLLGLPQALGHAFHITSDEVLTWDQIHRIIGDAAGCKPELVHVPSELVARFDAGLGASLLGDKAHSVIFDNGKIKRFVPGYQAALPFAQGVRRVLAWLEADPVRQTVDAKALELQDRILAAYRKAYDA